MLYVLVLITKTALQTSSPSTFDYKTNLLSYVRTVFIIHVEINLERYT
jgi:hypothetical protein